MTAHDRTPCSVAKRPASPTYSRNVKRGGILKSGASTKLTPSRVVFVADEELVFDAELRGTRGGCYPTKQRRRYDSARPAMSTRYKTEVALLASNNAQKMQESQATESCMLMLGRLRKTRPDLWDYTGFDAAKEDHV